MADDATSFAEAVEAELHDWDAAIERLQTRAATKAQEDREQAEAEIAALRQARNRAAERLTALRASSDDAWQEHKSRVMEALDELERKVREAAAEVPVRRRHMTTESTPTETFESKVNEKINEATSEGERMLARAGR